MNSYIGTGLFGSLVVDQESMERYAEEERQIRQENIRLQRKLQMEIERREQMCRRLSESESSIEMDEERSVNVIIETVTSVAVIFIVHFVSHVSSQLRASFSAS